MTETFELEPFCESLGPHHVCGPGPSQLRIQARPSHQAQNAIAYAPKGHDSIVFGDGL